MQGTGTGPVRTARAPEYQQSPRGVRPLTCTPPSPGLSSGPLWLGGAPTAPGRRNSGGGTSSLSIGRLGPMSGPSSLNAPRKSVLLPPVVSARSSTAGTEREDGPCGLVPAARPQYDIREAGGRVWSGATRGWGAHGQFPTLSRAQASKWARPPCRGSTVFSTRGSTLFSAIKTCRRVRTPQA